MNFMKVKVIEGNFFIQNNIGAILFAALYEISFDYFKIKSQSSIYALIIMETVAVSKFTGRRDLCENLRSSNLES